METILTPGVLNSMNASRKADRGHILHELATIADRHGAAVQRRDEKACPGFSGAGIHLEITLNGVGAMVDINNVHGGSYALIHWYGTECRAQNFAGRFSVAVGGGCGRPHHKATSCPDTWFALAKSLDAGLYLAARGEAFAA